jgi:hypothetical protein
MSLKQILIFAAAAPLQQRKTYVKFRTASDELIELGLSFHSSLVFIT